MMPLTRRDFVKDCVWGAGLLAAPAPAWALAYEGSARLASEAVLPADLIRSPHHEVVGEVTAQGFSNRYLLRTPYGRKEVVTFDMLQIRIIEAIAIAEMEKLKDTKAFSVGLANAAKSPYKAVKALVNDPVDVLMGVPEGIYKFARRIGEMIGGDRGEHEDTYVSELVGFSRVKRALAYRFGVDVYSTDKRLQQNMNDLAYAGFAGGFAFNQLFGLITLPAALATGLSAVEFTRTANQIIRDNAPEDLRLRNARALADMGAREEEIDAFLDNESFSPRHETIITLALEDMEGVEGRAALIRRAPAVDSEVDALLMQRSAEMMRSFHTGIAPVAAVERVGGNVGMVTEEGRLIVAMPADRIHWTRWFARTAGALATHTPRQYPVRRREIWLAGGISDQAVREARALGVTIEIDARKRLVAQDEEVPLGSIGREAKD